MPWRCCRFTPSLSPTKTGGCPTPWSSSSLAHRAAVWSSTWCTPGARSTSSGNRETFKAFGFGFGPTLAIIHVYFTYGWSRPSVALFYSNWCQGDRNDKDRGVEGPWGIDWWLLEVSYRKYWIREINLSAQNFLWICEVYTFQNSDYLDIYIYHLILLQKSI